MGVVEDRESRAGRVQTRLLVSATTTLNGTS